jgi:hypothetical protein
LEIHDDEYSAIWTVGAKVDVLVGSKYSAARR